MVMRRGRQCRTLDLLFAGLWLGPVLYFVLVGSGEFSLFWSVVFAPQPTGSDVVTILYYTKWFGKGVPPYTGIWNNVIRTMPGGGDRQELARAHAVVFHGPDLLLAEVPAFRPFASQLWVYWSTESPLNDASMCGHTGSDSSVCDRVSLDPERMALFDLRMGYQLSSDVAITYIGTRLKNDTDRPMSPSWQERRNAVVWITNNCHSHNQREKYIEAFMKHYPVHSYGRCLSNMPSFERVLSDAELKNLTSQYKFAFAWENANCADYVTEKLARAFHAGGLPIVDGPDDYSVFVPNNHSVIRVSDFAGPKALADHLRRLESDQALYESYFTYKPPTSHYDPAFLAAEDALGDDYAGKLCLKVAQLRAEETQPQAGRREKVLQPDLSCTRGRWDREYYDNGTMSEQRDSARLELG